MSLCLCVCLSLSLSLSVCPNIYIWKDRKSENFQFFLSCAQ